jgi:hypothetical protein
MLLRFNDVRNGFMDDKRFSKSLALRPVTFPVIGPNIMGYDGEEHRIKRGMVSGAFGPRTIRVLSSRFFVRSPKHSSTTSPHSVSARREPASAHGMASLLVAVIEDPDRNPVELVHMGP